MKTVLNVYQELLFSMFFACLVTKVCTIVMSDSYLTSEMCPQFLNSLSD